MLSSPAPEAPKPAAADPKAAPAPTEAKPLTEAEANTEKDPSAMDWLLDAVGLHTFLADYAEEHPEWAQNVAAQLGKDVAEYTTEEGKIDWEALMAELKISEKITLLLQTLFENDLPGLPDELVAKIVDLKVGFEKKSLGGFLGEKKLKPFREALFGKTGGRALKSVDGFPSDSPHFLALASGDKFSTSDTLKSLWSPDGGLRQAFEKILPEFKNASCPLPAQSRWMLPPDGNNVTQLKMLKELGERATPKIKVQALSINTRPLPAPKEDEFQCIITDLTLSQEDVTMAYTIYKDQNTPCLFSSAPMLAAILVKEGKEPAAACATVGLKFTEQMAAFLNEVKTGVSTGAAAGATGAAGEGDKPEKKKPEEAEVAKKAAEEKAAAEKAVAEAKAKVEAAKKKVEELKTAEEAAVRANPEWISDANSSAAKALTAANAELNVAEAELKAAEEALAKLQKPADPPEPDAPDPKPAS